MSASDNNPIFWDPESGTERPKMTVWQKLAWVQARLVVPKGRGKGNDRNAKVEYAFRNASDILARVKPLCFEVGAVVTTDVSPVVLGEMDKPDVRAVRLARKDAKGEPVDAPTYALLSGPHLVAICTAVFTDAETGEFIEKRSYAEQDAWRKGQAEPEKRSGSTDSYGVKYALGKLFAIDDEKDADMLSNEGGEESAGW